jgi:hypothetical protein
MRDIALEALAVAATAWLARENAMLLKSVLNSPASSS